MIEAIYDIKFDVDRSVPSVNPTVPQRAGTFGDNEVAKVTFNIADSTEGKKYRIEVVDGGGAYDITGLLDAVDGEVTYYVPSAWTTAGVATLRLIEISLDGNEEDTTFHYPPVYLSFADKEDAPSDMLPRWQAVMTRLETSVDGAVASAAAARASAEAAAVSAATIKKGDKGEKGDKGDTGDTGGSIDESALDEILAIQQELIGNGKVEIEGNLPDVRNEGDVLTVVDGEWKSAPPSGGGQAEFATVTDIPAGGKRLETDGMAFWDADSISLNGAFIKKSGDYATIGGVLVPNNYDPYVVVNQEHLEGEITKAKAEINKTLESFTPREELYSSLSGYQGKFANVSREDWGVGLQAEKRLHINAETVMVNNASFAVDNTGFSVLTGVVVPENASPFTAANKMYVDDAIANVGSGGGGGGGGVDYIIEEGSAQIKNASGIPLSSKPAKYRKWNNGFVEVDASFDYAPASCNEMEAVYSLGSISFNIHDTSGSKKLFAGGVIQAYCSFSAIGSWCSCFAIGGEGVDVVLNFYSAIPENTTPFTVNVYIRGYWK